MGCSVKSSANDSVKKSVKSGIIVIINGGAKGSS